MGLAASQARFLGITARKSNIEYEGQQVNQQRTALAEEVNALYNKLLSLKLPIAPDTTEFYESDYSFSVSDTASQNSGDYLIKNYYSNPDGETYFVTTERTYNTIKAQGSDLSYSGWRLYYDENHNLYIVNDKEQKPYSVTQNVSEEKRKEMVNLINQAATRPEDKIPEETTFYSYQVEGKTHYIPDFIVDKYFKDNSSQLYSYIETYERETETKSFENARLTFDENNRLCGIKLDDSTTTLEVGTTRTYDTEGYDAALRDYTMSKDEYDKMVADLNAQTESLQQEDKVLELRLNQIDTEQNELQTELEAVKQILDKNIENTFKTFA